MKKYAVIVAAGSGSRMGKEIPKQFLHLGGKPILFHTVDTFLSSYNDLQIILVIPSRFISWADDLVKSFGEPSRITLVEGGNTRFQSVRNGLTKVKENSVVFVHDGVRCLITGQLNHRCYEQAIIHGSAVPTVATTETVRIVEGESNYMMDRKLVRMVQTPQTFLSTILLKAFQSTEQEFFTDESVVVEHSGEKVHLIEGEFTNIKITRPQDLAMAEYILKVRQGATPQY
jgi:2-C-methyl-D-erythritol 4-phosphate cytidylyltransferase